MARKTFVILCIILAIGHVLIGEGRKKQPITKGRKDTMKGIPMKRYTVAFTMLLTFALLFGLTACQQNEAVSPATDGVMESTPPSEQTTVPEITDSEPTAFTVPPDFEVRREQEEISLYPFTAEELDAALETVQEYLGDVFKELGVLTYEVERIAYDPIMTDVHYLHRGSGRGCNS